MNADERYMRAVERRDWDEASAIVDARAESQGYTHRMYHGTTHEFNVFRLDRVNIENDFGRGFYFTSSEEDASENYAGIGPDLETRIKQLAERLVQDNEDGEMDRDAAMLEATRQLVGPVQRLLRIRVRLENPAKLGGQDETRLEWETTGGEDDEGNYGGTMQRFIDAVNVVGYEFYGTDPGEIMVEAQAEDGDSLREVLERIRGSGRLYPEGPNGEMALGEMLRRIVEEMGFDGIVDRTVAKRFQRMKGVGGGWGVYHIIAFRPDAAKLDDVVTRDDEGNVIPPSKRFDPGSDDIRNPRQGPREFPWEWAEWLRTSHPNIWRKGGNVRGNATYRLWTRRRQGERTSAIENWWNVERPAWHARHRANHRLAGVVAQIKWGVVGDLGVAGMKRVVMEAI